jgi:hypothetical protein
MKEVTLRVVRSPPLADLLAREHALFVFTTSFRLRRESYSIISVVFFSFFSFFSFFFFFIVSDAAYEPRRYSALPVRN